MKKLKNKKIGMIGGVGPQATSVLYGEIIKFAQRKYKAEDNDDYPRVVIESVPIPDFISDTKKINEALEMLVKVTNNLEKIGATRLCIASNTVHLLLKELQKVTKIPFISIVESVAQRAKDRGCSKLGLVGSSVMLNSDLYPKILGKYNIEVILPNQVERKVVDKIIRYVLAGEDNGRERRSYVSILNNLITSGADGIILACTELPLAINYEALGDKVLNSMKILAECVADYYYS